MKWKVNDDSIPITGYQFRANIIVEGNEELEEDNMRWLQIHTDQGDINCEIVRYCSRCIATTLDYDKLKFSETKEPLRTIMKYWHNELGNLFGSYF